MAFARTWRAAKPMTAAAIALEARIVLARRWSSVNCATASARPITMIVAPTTRRRNRRRVSTTGLSSPPDTAATTLRARPFSVRSTTYARTAVPSRMRAALMSLP